MNQNQKLTKGVFVCNVESMKEILTLMSLSDGVFSADNMNSASSAQYILPAYLPKLPWQILNSSELEAPNYTKGSVGDTVGLVMIPEAYQLSEWH